MAGRWTRVNVDGKAMSAYLAQPEGDGPFPGLVVIMEAFGVNDHFEELCERYAGEGFTAISPDLFHRQGERITFPYDQLETARGHIFRMKDSEIVADLQATVAHLGGLDRVASDRTGIVGYCFGGRVAYLAAGAIPELGAAVVYYGGNTMVSLGDGPTPLERTSEIRAAVLGLFGETDQNPSPSDVEKIAAELEKHGKTHEFHSYANAGHGFFNDRRASFAAEAAADCWPKTLVWLRRYV